MVSLVPEVHLFVCLDDRVSPGAILHSLDIARAQDWQQETVLICEEKWRPFVNVDQPVIFIDRQSFFQNSAGSSPSLNVDKLETLLEQLDNFEISKVTQIGELSWGRWLSTYFAQESNIELEVINWDQNQISSLQVINDIAQELALDISTTQSDSLKSSAIYIDPYCGDEVSPQFIQLVEGLKGIKIPTWMSVVTKEKDMELFKSYGLGDCLVDICETQMSLFNQSILCFSDMSPFALTSRSYNVALFQCSGTQSLFVPGDILIETRTDIHISELFNILTYWKSKRLKELAFQWLNMGIDIHHIEAFHSRVVKRNLLNYSSDLFHCQYLVKSFVEKTNLNHREIKEAISYMRREINNDPYSLSFSLKILLMIVERMLASANCGERLFQRLGSDYHRIIIGEALVEGLIQFHSPAEKDIDLKKQLSAFLNFLVKIDHHNDQTDVFSQSKES